MVLFLNFVGPLLNNRTGFITGNTCLLIVWFNLVAMANMINSEVDELRSGIFVIFGSNTVVRACIMSVRLPVVDLNWTKFESRHKRFIFYVRKKKT